jgi:hypothetical protein
MWRKATAVCLIAAPIALAISTGIDPALGQGEVYGIYRQHPEALQWHSLLLHWAWLLFVPGFVGLLLPIRRRGAILAALAWPAVLIGLVTFAALMAGDFALLAREQAGLTDAQLTAVDDRFGTLTWATAGWQAPGLLGWALSLVLVPIAAARARVINWWAAGAALLGAGLYFLFAISPVPVNLLGPVTMLVAYAMAGRQLITGRDRRPAEPDLFGAWWRRAGQVCLVAAPLSFAVGMALVPPGAVVDHPRLTQASAFFLHLAWVLFVPAVLLLAQRGRRLTRIAAGVAVLGLLNFSGLMVGDYFDLAGRLELEAATVERINENMSGYPTFTFGWLLPGMLLTFLGLLLVVIAAAVEKVLRWWVPALVGAGLTAFLAVTAGPLGVLGPVLMIAGFGAAIRPRRPAREPAAREAELAR